MQDIYLCFPTIKAGVAAMQALSGLDDVPAEFVAGDCQVSVLGKLTKPTGETETVEIDGEAVEQAVTTAVKGYHVNIRCRGDLPDDLQQYVIARPGTPARRFF